MPEPTVAERMQYDAWLATRPEIIRELGKTWKPWNEHRLLTTGQRVRVTAFYENGTLKVIAWRDDGPAGFDRLSARCVFGIDPKDVDPAVLPDHEWTPTENQS